MIAGDGIDTVVLVVDAVSSSDDDAIVAAELASCVVLPAAVVVVIETVDRSDADRISEALLDVIVSEDGVGALLVVTNVVVSVTWEDTLVVSVTVRNSVVVVGVDELVESPSIGTIE